MSQKNIRFYLICAVVSVVSVVLTLFCVSIYQNINSPKADVETFTLYVPASRLKVSNLVELDVQDGVFSIPFTSAAVAWIGDENERPTVLIHGESSITLPPSPLNPVVGESVKALCTIELPQPDQE